MVMVSMWLVRMVCWSLKFEGRQWWLQYVQYHDGGDERHVCERVSESALGINLKYECQNGVCRKWVVVCVGKGWYMSLSYRTTLQWVTWRAWECSSTFIRVNKFEDNIKTGMKPELKNYVWSHPWRSLLHDEIIILRYAVYIIMTVGLSVYKLKRMPSH